MSRYLRYVRIAGLLVVFVLPTLAMQLPPVRAALTSLVSAMRSGGAAGVAIYVAAYAVGAIFTAPIAVMSGLAGYAYGPVRGLLIASPACLLAAVTTFFVGRYVLRGALERRLGEHPRVTALARAVASDGLRITLLLRLTPIMPQNFLSYILSLTRVRARDFAAGTWLGLLPMTCFQVYVGSLVSDIVELLEGGRPPLGLWATALPALGLVISIGFVILTSRLAKRAMDRMQLD